MGQILSNCHPQIIFSRGLKLHLNDSTKIENKNLAKVSDLSLMTRRGLMSQKYCTLNPCGYVSASFSSWTDRKPFFHFLQHRKSATVTETDKPGFPLLYFIVNHNCRPNKSHTVLLDRMIVSSPTSRNFGECHKLKLQVN